jgi:hypothetical protein
MAGLGGVGRRCGCADPVTGRQRRGGSEQARAAMAAAITRHRYAPGKPITAATLARIRVTRRVALTAAVRWGLLSENPASRAELPTARRPRAVVWDAYAAYGPGYRRTGLCW